MRIICTFVTIFRIITIFDGYVEMKYYYVSDAILDDPNAESKKRKCILESRRIVSFLIVITS